MGQNELLGGKPHSPVPPPLLLCPQPFPGGPLGSASQGSTPGLSAHSPNPAGAPSRWRASRSRADSILLGHPGSQAACGSSHPSLVPKTVRLGLREHRRVRCGSSPGHCQDGRCQESRAHGFLKAPNPGSPGVLHAHRVPAPTAPSRAVVLTPPLSLQSTVPSSELSVRSDGPVSTCSVGSSCGPQGLAPSGHSSNG